MVDPKTPLTDAQKKQEIIDQDLVVKHATEAAQDLFPQNPVSWHFRILAIVAAIFLITNTIISVINTTSISKQNSCSLKRSQALTALRNQDQTSIDHWINGVTDQIVNDNNLSRAEVREKLTSLRTKYLQERANNDAQRDRLAAITCT